MNWATIRDLVERLRKKELRARKFKNTDMFENFNKKYLSKYN